MDKKVITIFMFLLLTFSCNREQSGFYDAIVDAGDHDKSNNGTPIFKSIKAALATVPADNNSPFTIYLKTGRYYEKLTIDKPMVTFLGEDRESTIISFDATGDSEGPDGEKLGTRGCFTLRITAPDFHAENLTIENGFDYSANAAKNDDDPSKVKNPQAVALMTEQDNDRAIFRHCTISGYQDTFFGDAGRHYFYQCKILGHVDFIFGAGQCLFRECEIVSRNRENKSTTGYITAPSTLASYPYGFLFQDCRFTKVDTTVPQASVCLGRPWHPEANLQVSGSAVFIHCFMDDHISAAGYAKISSQASNGERIWFELEPDSRFFEYNNYGPGALESPTRPGLDKKSAQWYTQNQLLNGWRP
ncbi:MAG: pectinesterase A [Candidatus Marinimicrobia bacterium]|nr:pectinesterase A [Candidatus Neomarinimicrobiota bacterium]